MGELKRVEIRVIDEPTLIKYIKEQKDIGYRDIKEVKGTLCLQTTTWLLNEPSMQPRALHGIFYHDTLAGYAISYTPKLVLDLLHIYPLYRGIGLAKILINGIGIREVVVNKNNIIAKKLYDSLGFIKNPDDDADDYEMKR
jgi:ribosomal protein S18 acetylase RimI-like enzyme